MNSLEEQLSGKIEEQLSELAVPLYRQLVWQLEDQLRRQLVWQLEDQLRRQLNCQFSWHLDRQIFEQFDGQLLLQMDGPLTESFK